MNPIAKFGLLGLVLALGACSVLQNDKIDYKSAGAQGPALDVPPDLTQLTRDSKYVVPGAAVTASNYKVGQVASAAPTAASSLGDIRIERAGTQRWLVVAAKPDQLWQTIKEFWQENGFILDTERPDTGVMETDWAENRAKIGEDVIRRTLGRLLDSLYSTPERDKFRTRLETNAAGETEIYISHRGMIEIYKTEGRDQTIWQPRPADPELEADFLRRLMVRMGTDEGQAKKILAVGERPAERAKIIRTGNDSMVEM
ncbi:outer membrane protein assembly factor BamC, partial [Rhodoferax sp.]|uniref:outer membrane protein assembly factor BamC n=1 Tax=Rhodoferax sp. TaxID=50421 RepID=UPI00374DBB04